MTPLAKPFTFTAVVTCFSACAIAVLLWTQQAIGNDKAERQPDRDRHIVSKEINLPHDQAQFVRSEGYDTFVKSCTVCHSLRYVTMQPKLSRKAWQANVDKMVKTFGAHITKEEARAIVNYLVTVKGDSATVKKR